MSSSNGKICFSPIQTISLPPEAWYLVTQNIGKAEMRLTLCLLFNHFEVGSEAMPLTFGEIVAQTKMSKSSVLDGLNAAIERGSVFRKVSRNQPAYEPRFGKTEPMTCNTHDTVNHDLKVDKEETCHGSEKSEREKILKCLVRFGLAYHVAHNIAMTNRYPLEDLQNQLLYIFHETRTGEAPKGRAFFGYAVNRIKFNRFKPKYFDKPLAQVEMVSAEFGLDTEEVFFSYYTGMFDAEIQGLEHHPDYLRWFDQAQQSGALFPGEVTTHENV